MIKVNLLSPEKKDLGGGGPEVAAFPDEDRAQKINAMAAIAAAVITVGIIGFMYFTQAATLEEKESLLVERRARKAELDIVLQTLLELEKAKKLLDRKVKLIAELKSRQQDAVKMMDQLSNALPDWVWVKSVSFSGKLLSLSGSAIHNNLISDFINNLKGTGSFYNIQFPGSSRQNKSGLDIFNFRLTCYYRDKDQQKPETPKKKGRKV
ncbi:MAG: PilN domain-containing protein [bacterium]|nr:PilN domain-containing protein [bacterium]